MKNTKYKLNKTKLIARVMLLVLLASSVFSFAGCAKVPDGYYYHHDFPYYISSDGGSASLLQIYAVSNTEVFDINDVTFNLLYGTHANKYIGRQDLKQYESSLYSSLTRVKYDEYAFALYLSKAEYRYEFPKNVEDISNISNHKFITKIPDKNFSENYGYVIRYYVISKNIYCKHIEQITIPADYFDQEHGTFIIKFVAYGINENHSYEAFYDNELIIKYKKIDNQTIEIDFYQS